ncbi:maestro heat-like repeat-containing protein family member 2B [Phasianus colchicus]|uniref:maestro heat-like repeat-containing protein family member 2B n=1 Tax=Phasianus colchicus TaxID=9054 RepID=UPI00129D537F|nr:maestro heat-like repeat-containing protein family member 2B [Phasianus colchicus]
MRALQTFSQLLAASEELRRGDACKHFGSLVGLLAPLTCDPMPTSRQLAVSCLHSLLQIQAKETNTIETGDIRSLCEGLHACSTTSQLQTSSKIARVSGPKKGCGISVHRLLHDPKLPPASHTISKMSCHPETFLSK